MQRLFSLAPASWNRQPHTFRPISAPTVSPLLCVQDEFQVMRPADCVTAESMQRDNAEGQAIAGKGTWPSLRCKLRLGCLLRTRDLEVGLFCPSLPHQAGAASDQSRRRRVMATQASRRARVSLRPPPINPSRAVCRLCRTTRPENGGHSFTSASKAASSH